MEHCTQENTILNLDKTLKAHIKEQKESDIERFSYRKERETNDEKVSKQLDIISSTMDELLALNKEVNDFKTAWRIGKKIGFGLAAFIATMSIITGGIYAIKEWFKK